MVYEISPNEAFLKKVCPAIDETLKTCELLLPPKLPFRVDVIHTDDPFVTDYMQGCSGIAVNERCFRLFINPDSPDWKQGTKAGASHEYNHLVRYHVGDVKDNEHLTILDNLALEGLAQVFEEEIAGHLPPWSKAVTEKQAAETWRKIQPSLGKIDHELYFRLFLKKDDVDFPHWAGYTLSYLIVKKRKKELGLSWPELMKLSSKQLIGSGLEE